MKHTRLHAVSWLLISALLIVMPVLLGWHWYNSRHQLLSEPPPRTSSTHKLSATASVLSLQTKVSYQSLALAAEQATAKEHTGDGRKRNCERLLGKRVCATAVWQYQIIRTGPVTAGISPSPDSTRLQAQRMRLSIPLSFAAQVSIEGGAAKLLGMRNKNFNGTLQAILDVSLDVNQQGCPILSSQIGYTWITEPRLRLIGRMKINLRKSVDKALRKKLPDLEQKMAAVIDCKRFTQRLQHQWKTHYIQLDTTKLSKSHIHHTATFSEQFLKITPLTLAFSGTQAQKHHLAFSFAIEATTQTVQQQKPPVKYSLPPIEKVANRPGSVQFNLLARIDYATLNALLGNKLIGKTYRAHNDSTELTITGIDSYPSADNLAFKIDFTASTGYRWLPTSGSIYLAGKPQLSSHGNTLQFTQITFTRKLDSRLWRVLSNIFQHQLLSAISDNARLDLRKATTRLEQSIANTLANPAKTGGVQLYATPPQVQLVALHPESHSLAAIVRVSTTLQALIPEALIR